MAFRVVKGSVPEVFSKTIYVAGPFVYKLESQMAILPIYVMDVSVPPLLVHLFRGIILLSRHENVPCHHTSEDP